MALTKEDLSAIKTIVETVVDEKVDGLAVQVGEGFNEVSKRFEQVDRRFDRVERRLDRIETDIREVKWDLADTVRRGEFMELRDRVTELEKKDK